MDCKYYCQCGAMSLRKHILPAPDHFKVREDALMGLSNDAFVSGFQALQQNAARMYEDMAADPEDYDLELNPVEKADVEQITRSLRDINRFGNTIFSLAGWES